VTRPVTAVSVWHRFAGPVAAVSGSARCAWMKTCGACPATVSPGSARTVANRMGLETSEDPKLDQLIAVGSWLVANQQQRSKNQELFSVQKNCFQLPQIAYVAICYELPVVIGGECDAGRYGGFFVHLGITDIE